MKISKAQLKQCAGSGSWERGNDYYQRGHVISLVEDKDTVTAKVRGSRNYTVELTINNNQLSGDCTCPMDDMGVFCKHCVAAGLAYIDGNGSVAIVDKLRQFLSNQNKETLLDLITGRLVDDDILREQIILKAAREDKTGCDMDVFKSAIRRVMNTGGFVDCHDSYDFYKKFDIMLNAIEELLEKGYAERVIELTEFALRYGENAISNTGDSEIYMQDIFERLKLLHHNACVKAEPDPEKRAKMHFEWKMSNGWHDTFYPSVDNYADVPGKEGIDFYKKLAQPQEDDMTTF